MCPPETVSYRQAEHWHWLDSSRLVDWLARINNTRSESINTACINTGCVEICVHDDMILPAPPGARARDARSTVTLRARAMMPPS